MESNLNCSHSLNKLDHLYQDEESECSPKHQLHTCLLYKVMTF